MDTLRTLGVDYAQGYHIGRPAALPSIAAPVGPVSPASLAGPVAAVGLSSLTQ